MSTPLSDLIPLLNVPRVPQALQLQALRNSCRKFCRDTEWWREDLASFDTVVDTADYALTNPNADTLLLRAYEVERDGIPLHECNWTFDGTTLTFDPPPTEVAAIVVKVVFLPEITCNSVSDSLVARFGEAIAAGARYELKRNMGAAQDPNPAYDPEGAALARQDFETGVWDARSEVYSQRESGDKMIDLRGGIF